MYDLFEFIVRFILFATLHSFLAIQHVQEFLKSRMGSLASSYRLLYNILALVTFGWVMNAYHDSPILYQLPETTRPLGFIGQGVMLILLCVCAAQTGVGDFLGFRQLRSKLIAPILITNGCYGRVRHPQYLLAMLFLLFTPTMTVRWLVLTLLSALYFLCGAIMEERRLIEMFGDNYRGYQRGVRMFIPIPKKRS
ncbi:MAG: isoprenylcysteine carboxylmethyltransferase family protein [Geobacter sp.]|nr:MAG: isoprenylcysteine carboxylmethyltransferase family protein [Geobacter sp.]